MVEIASTPDNGLVAASLFAGCGGSALGLRMAGFRIAWANEFDALPAAVHRANFPETVVNTGDVRRVSGATIVEACGGAVDLLDGSPPCQQFSMAGKRSKNWGKITKHGGRSQERAEDMFFEFARLVGEVRPRAFVAENVSGLYKGVAKGYFLEILAKLKAQGYIVECRALDAQWLGVPQSRLRAIFVGVREDLGVSPAFPKPLLYRYSLRDAIGKMIDGELLAQASNSDYHHPTLKSSDVPAGTVQASPGNEKGGGMIGVEYRRGGWKGDEKMNLGAPLPSIDVAQQGRIKIIHVGGRCKDNLKLVRKFTIAELRSVCSFPADFILLGSYAQQWRCLGNAVPPLMMRAIAETIRDKVFSKIATK